MSNEILVTFNGIRFNKFKDASIKLSLDALGGTFSFSTLPKSLRSFPIKAWDRIDIMVNGHTTITGYVTNLKSQYSATDHSVTFSGADVLVDLVDCSVRTAVAMVGAAPASGDGSHSYIKEGSWFGTKSLDSVSTFSGFVSELLASNGFPAGSVTVTDNSNASFGLGGGDASLAPVGSGGLVYREDEIISAKVGDSLFEVIEREARKRACMVISNGMGGIILYRNNGILAPNAPIINKEGQYQKANKILSATSTCDTSKRFAGVVICAQNTNVMDFMNPIRSAYTQTNIGRAVSMSKNTHLGLGVPTLVNSAYVTRDGKNAQDAEKFKNTADMTVGGAEDREVPRTHRILVKVPDENAAPEDLNAMAAWEVAKRKADSYQYEATFMGYNDTSGKDIWRLGQVHTVDDDFCGVKGSMMVKEIEFRIDETNGHHTIVNFISADAYTLEVGTPQLPVLQKEGDRVSSQRSATASSPARDQAEKEYYRDMKQAMGEMYGVP